MTINDIRRKFDSDPTIMGVSTYCVHCRGNLMCAPKSSFYAEHRPSTQKRYFDSCPHCNRTNPAIEVRFITNDDWDRGDWEHPKYKKK